MQSGSSTHPNPDPERTGPSHQQSRQGKVPPAKSLRQNTGAAVVGGVQAFMPGPRKTSGKGFLKDFFEFSRGAEVMRPDNTVVPYVEERCLYLI